eukprot:jgi/Hompol1/4724/HPOL_001824-RA
METKQNISAPAAHYPLRMVTWRVSDGDSVDKDQPLGIYECDEHHEQQQQQQQQQQPQRSRHELRSMYAGRVGRMVPVGDTVAHKDADYTGTETVRATLQITHDGFGVKISEQEALRIECETASRLLDERKLTLVLDLDQTVIHAAVDPTVGEWMADPDNPNYPALTCLTHAVTICRVCHQDVYKFALPESPGQVYYIKLRPGTREFLDEISMKYEMHIYTMGTRNYANFVAKILDPTGLLFGNRILSRDDSGSFSFKSLQRLFPCDQSMVVIVDDRADVWHWSPNLLRIKAYDFFVGIGDINEPVYAVANEINEAHHRAKVAASSSDRTVTTSAASASPSPSPTAHSSTSSTSTATASPSTPAGSSTSATTLTVAAPSDILSTEIPELEDGKIPSDTESDSETSEHKAEILAKMQDRPVLVDNDRELSLIRKLMNCIHKVFYQRFSQGNVLGSDVGKIIPEIKHDVLSGAHILFTSVIPLGYEPQKHEYWISATLFGAVCHLELDNDVTHVIAGKIGTAKVNAAKKRDDLVIVKLEWLLDSLQAWTWLDETPYLIYPDTVPQSVVERQISAAKNSLLSSEDLALQSNDEDVLIAHGQLGNQNEIFELIGRDDWNEMDKEIEQAMMEDSDNDDKTSQLSSRPQPTGGGDDPLAVEDDLDWDALDQEIELGLKEVLADKLGNTVATSAKQSPARRAVQLESQSITNVAPTATQGTNAPVRRFIVKMMSDNPDTDRGGIEADEMDSANYFDRMNDWSDHDNQDVHEQDDYGDDRGFMGSRLSNLKRKYPDEDDPRDEDRDSDHDDYPDPDDDD